MRCTPEQSSTARSAQLSTDSMGHTELCASSAIHEWGFAHGLCMVGARLLKLLAVQKMGSQQATRDGMGWVGAHQSSKHRSSEVSNGHILVSSLELIVLLALGSLGLGPSLVSSLGLQKMG